MLSAILSLNNEDGVRVILVNPVRSYRAIYKSNEWHSDI